MFNHIPGNVNKEIEQKEKSSNDVVITNILEKPIKRIKKIESVNDLYNNYFYPYQLLQQHVHFLDMYRF